MEWYNLLFGNLCLVQTCLAEIFLLPAVVAYNETEVWYGRQRSKYGQKTSGYSNQSKGEIIPAFLWFGSLKCKCELFDISWIMTASPDLRSNPTAGSPRLTYVDVTVELKILIINTQK